LSNAEITQIKSSSKEISTKVRFNKQDWAHLTVHVAVYLSGTSSIEKCTE